MSSFLLPLEVEGKGTPAIESFASYYGRLACMHLLGRCQLANLLTDRWSNKIGRPFAISHTPVYTTQGAGLFGFRERVEEYVRLVEDATEQNGLFRSTLIPIRQTLAETCLDTVKSDRAWCEACFEEDVTSDRMEYDRLIWTLGPVRRCYIHRLMLRVQCPGCGIAQRFHHRTGNPGLCVDCGGSLIGAVADRVPMLQPDFGESDCIALIGAIACGALDNIDAHPFDRYEESLRKILSPVASLVAGISEISGAARANGSIVRPTLKTMLKKSFASGVPLIQILSDPVGAASAAGQLVFDRADIPIEARPRHPKEVREEVEKAFSEMLAKARGEMIPRLRDLARTVGVSEGYVRHRFPDLVRKYQSRRRAANVHRTNLKQAACLQEIRNVLTSDSLSYLLLNMKKLEDHLVEVSGCSYPLARYWIKVLVK